MVARLTPENPEASNHLSDNMERERKQIALLTSKLQVAIGENLGIAGIATWRWFEGEELEEARLRADQPDVVAPYLRPVAYRKFKVE